MVAIFVIDVWDKHWDKETNEYIEDLAERINNYLDMNRNELIVHLPSDCERSYPTHRRIGHKTNTKPPKIKEYMPKEIAQTTIEWSRQHPNIEIKPNEYVAFKGEEVYAILEQHEIKEVELVGIHMDACLMDRPWGAQALRVMGYTPIIISDLTEPLVYTKEQVLEKLDKDGFQFQEAV